MHQDLISILESISCRLDRLETGHENPDTLPTGDPPYVPRGGGHKEFEDHCLTLLRRWLKMVCMDKIITFKKKNQEAKLSFDVRLFSFIKKVLNSGNDHWVLCPPITAGFKPSFHAKNRAMEGSIISACSEYMKALALAAGGKKSTILDGMDSSTPEIGTAYVVEIENIEKPDEPDKRNMTMWVAFEDADKPIAAVIREYVDDRYDGRGPGTKMPVYVKRFVTRAERVKLSRLIADKTPLQDILESF